MTEKSPEKTVVMHAMIRVIGDDNERGSGIFIQPGRDEHLYSLKAEFVSAVSIWAFAETRLGRNARVTIETIEGAVIAEFSVSVPDATPAGSVPAVLAGLLGYELWSHAVDEVLEYYDWVSPDAPGGWNFVKGKLVILPGAGS